MQIKNNLTLEEADSYFERQKNVGVVSMSLTLALESVSHLGEGIYDEAYLANLRKVLLAAEREGISVTIEAKGFDENDAALQHAKRRLKNCKAVLGWE